MTEHVLTTGNTLRNSHRPGLVVGNEFGSSPLAIFKADLVDLEEVQVFGSSLGCVIDLCEVVEDRPDVRLWPCRPLNVDGATGLDLRDLRAGSSVPVASDLRHILVHIRGYKAIVCLTSAHAILVLQ